MAQFDVYDNPDVRSRAAYPYVVQLQSDLFDPHATRLVMPLVRMALDPAHMPRRLARAVEVQGEHLYPGAHLCAPLPARLLKQPVMSMRESAHLVLDALDAVISGV